MYSDLVVALVSGGFTMVAALGATAASYVAINRSEAAEKDVEASRDTLQRAAEDADRRADAAEVLDANRRPLLACPGRMEAAPRQHFVQVLPAVSAC